MNTYMYHMLLRAREMYRKNQQRLMGEEAIGCPFCKADCLSAEHEARTHMTTMELTCWKCPLLGYAATHEDRLEIMENCEEFGRELLWRFENAAGPVPEEEIQC